MYFAPSCCCTFHLKRFAIERQTMRSRWSNSGWTPCLGATPSSDLQSNNKNNDTAVYSKSENSKTVKTWQGNQRTFVQKNSQNKLSTNFVHVSIDCFNHSVDDVSELFSVVATCQCSLYCVIARAKQHTRVKTGASGRNAVILWRTQSKSNYDKPWKDVKANVT